MTNGNLHGPLLSDSILLGGGGSSSSWVVLVQGLGGDTLQHLTGEDTEQLPSNVQGFEDGTVLVVTCNSKNQIYFLELSQKHSLLDNKNHNYYLP